jgi:hypothetical protein
LCPPPRLSPIIEPASPLLWRSLNIHHLLIGCRPRHSGVRTCACSAAPSPAACVPPWRVLVRDRQRAFAFQGSATRSQLRGADRTFHHSTMLATRIGTGAIGISGCIHRDIGIYRDVSGYRDVYEDRDRGDGQVRRWRPKHEARRAGRLTGRLRRPAWRRRCARRWRPSGGPAAPAARPPWRWIPGERMIDKKTS